MQEAGIIPDVIDVGPTKLLQVTYPSGIIVDQGNDIAPSQVKVQPSLKWDADENAIYTLLMIDPDVHVEIREAISWLVVNIPGNNLSKGQSVMDYCGVGPPLGSGKHRFIFLVFKQSNEIKTNVYVSETKLGGRFKQKTRDLIKEYNLGIPVAGNFFRTEYDDYVPLLHSKLN